MKVFNAEFLIVVCVGMFLFAVSLDRKATWESETVIKTARDLVTGCQYLVTPAGGITPRLGMDGRQICTADDVAP